MTQYTPKTLPSLEDDQFKEWVRKELESISLALQNPDFLVLKTFHAAPNKYKEGMTLVADGTDWNPGSGAGVYTYYGAAWHKLG